MEAAQFKPSRGNNPNIGFEVAIDISPSQGNLTIAGWVRRRLHPPPSPPPASRGQGLRQINGGPGCGIIST